MLRPQFKSKTFLSLSFSFMPVFIRYSRAPEKTTPTYALSSGSSLSRRNFREARKIILQDFHCFKVSATRDKLLRRKLIIM